MATPPDHFQSMLNQHQQNQQQPSNQFLRNMYATDAGRYPEDANQFGDQPPHPAYVPSYVARLGLMPLAGAAVDEGNGGCNLEFGYGVEHKRRQVEVQNFFDNNSQISSLDILQPLSVSTGLGLSLDHGQMNSSGDSGLLSLISEDIGNGLQQQDAEMDRFLKVQAGRLRQAVLQKVQEQQRKTVSYLENKALKKLQEKESELWKISQKNMALEEQIEKEKMKVDIWKQRTEYNESVINSLRHNLQNLYAQNNAKQEGYGDSEINDTASCCNGRATDLHILCKENSYMQELMTCKGCGLKEVCMLLLPCKHLCLCKECEIKLSHCPMCRSSKFLGMEVYM